MWVLIHRDPDGVPFLVNLGAALTISAPEGKAVLICLPDRVIRSRETWAEFGALPREDDPRDLDPC